MGFSPPTRESFWYGLDISNKEIPMAKVLGVGGVLLIITAMALLRTSQIQQLVAPLGVITT